MNPHNRSFGLDFIRALAISLVLVSHFAQGNDFLGFWGVEMFFGLSGFLIGQILWRNFSNTESWTTKHMVNFWSRRWWRTLPNYYLFLIVSLVFDYFYYHTYTTVGNFSKYLWFGQNLLSRNLTFYGVSWSLCIEEWLYLLFPVVLFTYSKFISSKATSFVLTLFTFFVGCALFRYYLYTGSQADTIRHITLARVDAIATGMAVGYFFITKPTGQLTKKIAFALGILLLCLPLVIAFNFHVSLRLLQNNPVLLLLVPLGASLTLPLVSVWNGASRYPQLLLSGIEKMSLWSYSLYLCHMPVLFTVYSIMSPLRSNMYGNLLSKIVGLFVALIISSLLFKYFELPITRNRPQEIK